jgi:hypothetical protein
MRELLTRVGSKYTFITGQITEVYSDRGEGSSVDYSAHRGQGKRSRRITVGRGGEVNRDIRLCARNIETQARIIVVESGLSESEGKINKIPYYQMKMNITWIRLPKL